MVNGKQGAGEPSREYSESKFPWKTVLVIALLLAVVTFIALKRKSPSSAETRKGGRGAGAGGPVTAVIGMVEKKDFPIYLDGLGTVQAFNTVTVRSRVEGQLIKLAFQEGQDVHTGDLLAQIDPEPFRTQVAQAEAKKSQDEAQLENAQIELKRDDTLLKNKIVSQEIYDAQKATVNQLAAAVKADDAAIDNAKVQLAYTTIAAPIDGRIGLKLVDAGNIIRSGDSNGIVIVTQLKPISVLFTLPEQTMKQIQGRKAGEMKVLAVDRDNKTVLDEGTLTVVDNQIDTTTGTIRLKATFENAGLKLWPGQFVNARLLLSVQKDGVVVPAPVVQRGPEGSYAFVVGDDMKVQMAPVKVAQIDQGQALIESGLEPGQRVVVDGQYKLQPGSQVKATEPAGKPSPRTNTAEKTQGGSGKADRSRGGSGGAAKAAAK
jgi:multidrug efflux system membrane fusion protein